MKPVKTFLISLACFGLLNVAHAEDKDKGADTTHQHQTGDATNSDKAGTPNKMENMHEMMEKCMENHKDGKMCEHDMMTQCQGNMSKEECQKTMRKIKTEKTEKKETKKETK